MASSVIDGWIVSCLLLGLRIVPAFAFAPPFTLTRIPALFRVLFGLGVSACIVSSGAPGAQAADLGLGPLVDAGCRELLIGMVFVVVLQMMFAALYVAGRTLDIQAGFGLAVLIDPATQTQTPLFGTLFAMAAAAVFFALNGHAQLLAIMSASLQAVPLGEGLPPASIARLAGYISMVFVAGFGVAGGAILALFLADLAIAALSRTAPQLNVLIVGIQLKTLLLLLVLPSALGASGALLARMAAMALEAAPRLM